MKTFYIFLISLLSVHANAQTLTDTDTKKIFVFLFGQNASQEIVVNEADKNKALLFLNELVEGSCKMSAAQGLLEGSFTIKETISQNVWEIVKKIIKSSYSNCYKGAMVGNFYESVKVTLARNWKSAFAIRKQTGEW